MILWDIVRNWFVEFVFGGTLSTGEIVNGAHMGTYYAVGSDLVFNADTSSVFTNQTYLPHGNDVYSYTPFQYIDIADETAYDVVSNVGDWLSTTATIITLIALCLFLFLAVKWVFNVFRNTLERVGK